MGSKNPLVVLDDADSATAVNVAVQGAYFSTGQRCTASSRLIVTEGHSRSVRRGVDARSSATLACRQRAHARNRDRPGRGASRSSIRISNTSRVGQREGARLATGGERLKRATDGYYLAPALFVDATNAMRISREEIFGPVACVIRAQRLRRSARDCQRYRDRPVVRDRDDIAEARVAFQTPCPGRHGDGQPADRRR